MQTGVDSEGGFYIQTALVSLFGGQPQVNGRPLAAPLAAQAQAANGTLRLRWHDPALGTFGLECVPAGPNELRLRYWVEGQPETADLDSFGLAFLAVDGARAALRSGYTSWDGSEYVSLARPEPGVAPLPHTGYGLIQYLPETGGGSLVLGFERHDRFQHAFIFERWPDTTFLAVHTLWDRKPCPPNGRCESEWLLVFTHLEVEGALRSWAERVAKAAPQPPRLTGPPITGWCSWYNLYAALDEDSLRHHLQAAALARDQHGLPLRVFQIDDGFTPEMGDWLEVKPQFPRGLKPLLDEIRAAGFVPGLWIAPFVVGNRSRLYQAHPDWVVGDRQTGGPLVQMRLYGEFRWHKRSEEYYILDTTHPAAFEYLRTVFSTWRHEWGCAYFKTDFMFFGMAHGPDKAVWHTPGLTRVEVWRQAAEMIRAVIGESVWLGCGSPLWPAVGLVDALRVGRDVGVQWQGERLAQALLRDQALRNFANQVLWQNDPDCVLLRPRFHHLTHAEQRSLALFAGMTGGVMMTSDDLGEMPPEHLGWWRPFLSDRRLGCRFPHLGQTEDAVQVQVRPLAGERSAVFIFNTGDEAVERTLVLSDLGLRPGAFVHDWLSAQSWPEAVPALPVSLAPHDGALFVVGPRPWGEIPERLD